MQTPRKGAIAVCSIGALGLITADAPIEITYPDKTKGLAWTGIHLTNRRAPMGSPWASRTPIVLGHVEDITLGATAASWQESTLQVLLKGTAQVRGGDIEIVQKLVQQDEPASQTPEPATEAAWFEFAAEAKRGGLNQNIHPNVPNEIKNFHKHAAGEACRGCWDLAQLDRAAKP